MFDVPCLVFFELGCGGEIMFGVVCARWCGVFLVNGVGLGLHVVI